MNNTLDILIRIREDTKAALVSAEKNVQGFTSKANSFLNDHKQTIMEAGIAAAGLVATLGVVGKSFLDNASMIEQSRISFETMLGSSDKARKLLSQLSDFARKTPFDLPQVIEGSQRLLAYNISAEDIIPTFTMLGNIAAGVGKDKLPQLILAFGQVKAATKLTGAELRQFSEAGVPLLDTLAKNFKTTTGNIQEMISKGQISFADVQQALGSMTGEGGKFFNLMSKQSQTFSGVMSNIRDDLFRTSLTIMGISENGDIRKGSMFYYLKLGAEQLLKVLEKSEPAISAFVDGIMKNKTIIFAFLGSIAALVVLAVGAFLAFHAAVLVVVGIFIALGAAIGALIANWDLLKKKTVEVFSSIFNWAMQYIQPVIDFFDKLIGKISDFLGKASKIGGKALSSLGINIQARASGGPVSMNQPYLVGEQGPELFVPRNSGAIIPNGAMGGRSQTINTYVYATVNTPVDLNYLAYKIGYEFRNKR